MKTLLAGLLAAAAVAPASAAIVNVAWSWNGTAGNANGVIQVNYTVDGPITSGTLLSFVADGNTITPASLVDFSFTFSGGGTSAVQTTGTDFYINGSDALNTQFQGQQGGFWSLFDDGSLSSANGDTSLTIDSLTVVPEPEAYAAVAGAGLVAFGLFRRRAARA